MKWHELADRFGLPIAFAYPGWKDGDYFVIRTRTDVEFWQDHRKVDAATDALGMGAILSLHFYWYENDRWEPLFGFY